MKNSFSDEIYKIRTQTFQAKVKLKQRVAAAPARALTMLQTTSVHMSRLLYDSTTNIGTHVRMMHCLRSRAPSRTLKTFGRTTD